MKDKLEKIKVIALDVDGVLTDGHIIYNNQGEETKFFDVQDGLGLVVAQKLGFKTAMISSRESEVSHIRAKDLKLDLIYFAYPKTSAYDEMVSEFNVSDEEVCFIGDDLVDLPILKRVGFGVAVPNAVEDVKEVADYVTSKSGGHGAVREVIDMILKEQGKWRDVLAMME